MLVDYRPPGPRTSATASACTGMARQNAILAERLTELGVTLLCLYEGVPNLGRHASAGAKNEKSYLQDLCNGKAFLMDLMRFESFTLLRRKSF
ncbi:MAG TPA: hypothetical protein VGM81_18810 [Burkholderiaceae bacterium]|jgi:hypothetical protein